MVAIWSVRSPPGSDPRFSTDRQKSRWQMLPPLSEHSSLIGAFRCEQETNRKRHRIEWDRDCALSAEPSLTYRGALTQFFVVRDRENARRNYGVDTTLP
jgi:hypothetical protein